jgi:hypothetical protein
VPFTAELTGDTQALAGLPVTASLAPQIKRVAPALGWPTGVFRMRTRPTVAGVPAPVTGVDRAGAYARDACVISSRSGGELSGVIRVCAD